MVCYALKKFSDWRGDIRTKLLRSQSNRGLEIKELNKLLWKPYFPIESINLEITLKKSLMMRAFAHSKDLFGRRGSRQDQAGNNFWANFDSFFQRCIEDRREGFEKKTLLKYLKYSSWLCVFRSAYPQR
ncbi:uncharacterized protein [Ptychodera flava]|uniref:uncharacterized protein n=1 Tax=Ptychodera flava TaxID=63121 RepID=UPI00396A12A8